MATVSFDRTVSVNPDWGVRNLENAVNNAKDSTCADGPSNRLNQIHT